MTTRVDDAPAQSPLDVSIVIPLMNEEQNVDALHDQIHAALGKEGLTYEVIYIDDGSTDSTFQRLQALYEGDPHVRVIRFRRNFGQAAALAAGFEHAHGRVICPLDGDLQNDPADIARLVRKLDEGYDVVAGWRKDRQDPFISRVLPSRVANWIIGRVTGVRLHDYGCTLKAYRAADVQGIPFYNELHRWILLPAMAHWRGSKVCEEVINHRPRRHGTTKYRITRMVKVMLDLITVKFISGYGNRPIYIFGFVALVLFFTACLSGASTIYRKVFLDVAMHQDPLLVLTVLLLGLSALFLSLGLTAELVSRLHQESSNRAIYVVREVLEHGD